MQPGDKVRVVDGYYQGQEGHIEGMEGGKYIVVLQNDYGVVNTVLPEKRLEAIKSEYVITNKEIKRIRVTIAKAIHVLNNVIQDSDRMTDRVQDSIDDLLNTAQCLNYLQKQS